MTNRHFCVALLGLAVVAALLVGIGRYSNADLYLADLAFDFTRNAFPRRDLWFYEDFMHGIMKALMTGASLVPAAALAVDAATRRTMLDDRLRKRLAIVLASAILIPLTVSLLKSTSIHHCPWSIDRYGGNAPFLRIFDGLPAGASPGHCFPAGHATSGMWLAAVAVFWLPEKPLSAMGAFLLGLTPGLALGIAQQLRGAHFLTHTLWSAWISAFIILFLSKLMLRT